MKKKTKLFVLFLLNLFLFLAISISAKDIVVTTNNGVAIDTKEENPEQLPNTETNSETQTEEPKAKSNNKNKKAGLTPEQITKKKEILEKVLKFGSNKERREAMREVIHFPKEHANELYILIADSLATETDMGVKISYIKGLAEVGFRKNFEPIIKALSDKSDDVREAAIFAIQKMKLEEGTPEIVKLIKDQDFSKNQMITTNAITSLGELETGREIGGYLESKFREKTTHPNIRSAIALYFGKTKDKIAESALIDISSDESEDQMTRAYAVNSLGKMTSTKAVAPIRAILEKINGTKNKVDAKRFSNLKIYCISALVALGDHEILKELIVYAKDDDPNIRIRAIKQLSETPSKEVNELIEYKALRDPSKKVQEVAKKILEEFKKKEVDNSKPIPIQETPKPVVIPENKIDANKPEPHKPVVIPEPVKEEKPEVKPVVPPKETRPGKKKGNSWN